MKQRFFLLFSLFHFASTAQWSLGGTLDQYVAIAPKGQEEVPYLVSNARLNSPDINLLELELGYQYKNWKVQFSPAIGSYMNRNYTTEKPWRRYLYEGYLTYTFRKNEISLGTFSSPYTQETPRGVDQLSYSRSLAPEYVPYYISGFRYKYTLSKQWQAQLFLMNGWQHLLAEGNRLSYGSLLSSKKNKWNFNWSQYMGNMAPIGKVNGSIAVQKWRFLEEFNLGYTTNTWAFQSCVYVGMQRVLTSSNYWAQGNVQVEKTLRQNWHFNARAEVFRDPNKVMMSGADSPKSSFSVGWRKDIGSVLQCGQEARIFIGNSTQLPVFYQFLRLKFS